MAEPVKVPYPEGAESYVARIRELVETDRVRGARRLVAEAIEVFPDHPDLIAWSKLLSPAEVIKVGGSLDRDRTPEFHWLDAHGPEYRGEWVAVLGEQLIAHARDGAEFRTKLNAVPTDFPPLVVWIPD